MAGYDGFSMSNNARAAYADGEKPLSKWTKSEILDAIGEKLEIAKKLTVSELRNELLTRSSWHHTGKMYNCTDFYAIDEEAIEQLTSARVAEIIADRKPLEKKSNSTYITAKISYTNWEGRYKNYRKPVEHIEIVKFMSDSKMVVTQNGNKRLSSVDIIYKIEQRSKFATSEQLEKKQQSDKQKREREARRAEHEKQRKDLNAFKVFEQSKSGVFNGFEFVENFHKKYDKVNAIKVVYDEKDEREIAVYYMTVSAADGVEKKRVEFNRSVYVF